MSVDPDTRTEPSNQRSGNARPECGTQSVTVPFMHAYVRLDPVDQSVKLAEVAVPVVSADEVLVAVHAFGVGGS